MISFNLLVVIALAYVAFLFTVAFVAERSARQGHDAWLRSPIIYTLSLSIYCTAWTFYGAVGYAARSGLEYLTIYLGPTIVMIGWWGLLRKLVRIGRAQRITSIADLISSRFGKSTALGVIVTVLCVVGVTPYIALQLQSITLSFAVFASTSGRPWEGADLNAVALLSAAGLAVFTILFGTRNLDTSERHHGIVLAIAIEAVVKLAALLAVGIFVVWGLSGGVMQTLARIDASPIADWQQDQGRWIGLTFLSAAAFLCLPRMFHVMVVENADERHLATASWAFPLYVLLMSLFVVPIAVTGLDLMPAGSNPDLFVLTVPLGQGEGGIATLAFLGGFSSATSMVIVATIALATMVSNNIVVPIWLRASTQGAVISGDVRSLIILARRLSIGGVLGLGYVYFRVSGGGTALAAIGLISFAGVAQILPAMLGGLYWRGATRIGAAAGLLTGFAVWVWTMLLPGVDGVLSAQVLSQGPFGIGILRPGALFGIEGVDPVLHAVIWSLTLNAAAFVIVSLVTFPTPLERLQGAQFVNVFEHSGARLGGAGGAQAEDLLIMAQRIIGAPQAQAIFRRAARGQGKSGWLPDVTPDFIQSLERELSGSVGAATAHAMVGQLTEGATVSVEDLIAVADEAAQILEYSNRLEAKSAEQEQTARALRAANDKLTALSIQKDAFLSQISHELRTPMTSIRAFSGILKEGGAEGAAQRRYAAIVEDETIRLTRLLDNLLDLSVLENGSVVLNTETGPLGAILDRALSAAGAGETALVDAAGTRRLVVRREGDEAVLLETDLDRLAQVFINLVSNARKYCTAETPVLTIRASTSRGGPRPDWVKGEATGGEDVSPEGSILTVDFIDNGAGIPAAHQEVIFEKFSRLGDQARAGGAGLGLAICREVMERLGGSVTYLPGQGGAAFRVTLPIGPPPLSRAAE